MSQNTDETPRGPSSASGGASLRALWVVVALAVVVGALLYQVRRQRPIIPLGDLTVTSPTPAREILYREISGIKTGFVESRGIALDHAGGLYVVGDETVAYIDQHGQRRVVAQCAAKPQCIVVTGDDGGFFVGMLDHIERFNRDGVLQVSWPSLGPRACLTALAEGKDGAIWAADAGNREVVEFDSSGAIVRRIGRRDDARHIPGLVVPSAHLDVLVAADGSLVVTNPGLRQVEYYRASGDLLRSWGQSSNAAEGFAGCCNPTNIALLSDGRVVTSEKSLPRVKLYTADGHYLGMVAPPEAFRATTVGLALAVTPEGRIDVLDPSRNTVRIFVPKG
jgi:hypothetical protein